MNSKLMSLLLNLKSFLVLLVAGVALGGSLGVVLALAPGQSQEGEPPMDRAEQDELSKQFHEQPEWGFISRYGRTGRIQEVDEEGQTIIVSTPKGLLRAILDDNTAVRESKLNGKDLTFEDLSTGRLVTVNGESADDGVIAASEIRVINDGPDGYKIGPYSGEGPAFAPVFP